MQRNLQTPYVTLTSTVFRLAFTTELQNPVFERFALSHIVSHRRFTWFQISQRFMSFHIVSPHLTWVRPDSGVQQSLMDVMDQDTEDGQQPLESKDGDLCPVELDA